MSVEWKSKHAKLDKVLGIEKTEEESTMCAELNGATLQVYSIDTQDEGLHVRWSVDRPRKALKVYGNIPCTQEELKSVFAKAKKLAEDFALCWPDYFN